MKGFCSLFLTIISLLSCGQDMSSLPAKTIYSAYVKDSFEIYINAPKGADTMKQLSVIYYMDANLRSGKKLREMIDKPEFSAKAGKTIFVGVGHMSDFHVLRRRDFILPSINGNDTTGSSANYGQTENFYRFLQKELVPMINGMYHTNPDNNSILGHSLGGLFAFYFLFKNEPPF